MRVIRSVVVGLGFRIIAAALLGTVIYLFAWYPAPVPFQRAVLAANLPVALLTFIVPEPLHGVDDYLNPACRAKCLGISPAMWGSYFWLHLCLAVPVYTLLFYCPRGAAALIRRLRNHGKARV